MTQSPTTPTINMRAFRPLAEACYEAVKAFDAAIQNINKYRREAAAAKEEADGHLVVINTLREQIRLRHPGAPGVVGCRAWSHPEDYPDHGQYRPVDGDITRVEVSAIPEAIEALKQAMHVDQGYAWGWHCNIAMPLKDAVPTLSHRLANYAAARLMRHLFDVDMEANPLYPGTQIEAVGAAQALQVDELATEPVIGHKLFTEKASEIRTLLSHNFDGCKKQGWWAFTFDQFCDLVDLLTPVVTITRDSRDAAGSAPVWGGFDLSAEALAELGRTDGDIAVDPVQYEHFASEWHNRVEGSPYFGHAVLEWKGSGRDENLQQLGYTETKLYRRADTPEMPAPVVPERSNTMREPADEPFVMLIHPDPVEAIKAELSRPTPSAESILGFIETVGGAMDAEELAKFSDGISAALEAIGGDPLSDVVLGTVDDLRPLIEAPARRVSLTFTHPTLGDGFFHDYLMQALREFMPYMDACEGVGDFQPPKEPRYPFTSSNGVVVDVLPWKTVDEYPNIQLFDGQLVGHPLDGTVRIIRECAEELQELCGLSATIERQSAKAELMAAAESISGIHAAVEAGALTKNADVPTISAAMVRGDEPLPRAVVRDLTEKTVVEPSSNRGVQGVGDLPTQAEEEAFAILAANTGARAVGVSADRAEGIGRNPHFAGRFFDETLKERGQRLAGCGWTTERIEATEKNLDAAGNIIEPAQAMTPTIGRRVWYRPDPRTGSSGFIVIDHSQPLDAGIVWVWSPYRVNLDVTDHHGNHHAIRNVTLLQPGATPPANGAYAEWMPFQIKQARA